MIVDLNLYCFYMDIFPFLQYAFIQRAFVAGSFVAIVCSTLGIFLVLRKMSLIGDGLSHVSFGAIALGLFLGLYPFYIAIPVVMVGSILILKISEKAKIYGDASIGIVSAVGIASGVILASKSQGFTVDLMSYLFGNILSINTVEVALTMGLSFLVLTVVYLFYWDLFSATFDEEYAKATGVNTNFINILLTLLTSITVVLSVKVVGVMLVSALLILPAVTALQLAKGFRPAIVIGGVVSLVSVLVGISFSFFFDLPAGATIVMVNAFIFAMSLLLKKFA